MEKQLGQPIQLQISIIIITIIFIFNQSLLPCVSLLFWQVGGYIYQGNYLISKSDDFFFLSEFYGSFF